MDAVLAETVRRCLTEAGEAAGPLASGSSTLEATRYGEAERPDMKKRKFVQVRQKIYWKYHRGRPELADRTGRVWDA